MMEEYLRRALLLSRGDFSVLVTRPISATMLAIALIGGLIGLLPVLRDPQRRWAPLQALRRPVLQLPTGWPWLIGCTWRSWRPIAWPS